MSTKFNFGLPVKCEGLVGADARDVVTFWDDFLGQTTSETDNLTTWYVGAGVGTALPADGTDASQETGGGLLALTVEATASDCVSACVCGEMFQIDQGYELYFEARWMNVDVSALQTFIGLSASDTSCIAGLVNGIGFEGVSTVLNCVADNAGSTENVDAIAGITLEDGEWYRCAMYYDGADTVSFYWLKESLGGEMAKIHEMKLSTTADYVPQDLMLTPTIEAENAAADGSADLLYVDYVLCQQRRCRKPE